MNRLRTHKFKSNGGGATTLAVASINNNNNNNNNINNNDNNNTSSSNSNSPGSPSGNSGLLNKLSKRYSTLSNRITRRHTEGGRKSISPAKAIISGSYDMTGAHSDDHRLEIGAPILISTTTLDTDRLDVSAERLKQIGGGIAATSSNGQTFVRNDKPLLITAGGGRIGAGAVLEAKAPSLSPQPTSSGSETEVFVDALSTTPVVEEPEFLEALDSPPAESRMRESMKLAPPPPPPPAPDFLNESPPTTPTKVAVLTTPIYATPVQSSASTPSPKSTSLTHFYEAFTKRGKQKKLSKKTHSKSAQNLHRSELKVFLQRAPSMELDLRLTTADLENCRDLPKLPELYGASKCSLAASNNDIADDDGDADKENSSPSMIASYVQNKSEPNTPLCAEQKVNGYLAQQQIFKSVDSLELHRKGSAGSGKSALQAGLDKRRSIIFCSNGSSINEQQAHHGGSKTSLATTLSQASTIEGFNLKSVSCQSLNAQSLFVSIDELNEITRQINESEDFDRDIDLEYCTHRDQLKPNERRITLLKNKNTRLINFNHNKQKLKKGWSDVKHWLGEESTKLRDVVNKQTTLQRLGNGQSTSRVNLQLGSAECRQSPSVHGSVLLQRELTPASNANVNATEVVGMSCENITAPEHDDDLDSSCTQREEDGASPVTKRLRREGQNGFEELRRYVKQGGDFGKELILILQERVDSELLYSKSLSKMANKLNKACRELPGSMAEAWRGVATEMESRSDIHRQLSISLTDEIVKPLKNIVDSHHKSRKSVESNVDKAARVLAEWRVSEAKAKKSSHTAARENEKLQDAMLDVRIQKSPSIALLHQGAANKVAAEKEIKSAEKDCAKLDNKRKKAEEAVKRADVEYYTLCIRAERARVDWEMAVLRGSALLQSIENQRLINMKNFVANYARLTANMNPILDTLLQHLQPQVEACNVVKDMQVVKNIRRNSEGPSEQLLPDFYCEHTTLAMNRERRKHALIKLLQLVKTDLERERRSRSGLKGLSQSLNNQENQNITDKLYHIRSMLTYLEGARFKLHSALLELDHKPRSSHPLAQHIQITRDRTGLQQSVLKVPLWLKNNDKLGQSPNGGSNTSNNGDEVSSTTLEHEYDCISQTNVSVTNATNVSCMDLSKDMLVKGFSRSKSNIETFSGSTQICLNGKPSNGGHKSKTLDDPYSDRGQADGGSNQQDSDFDEFSSQDDDDEQTTTTNSARKEHRVTAEKTLANGNVGTAEHHYQNPIELRPVEQAANNNISNNNISSAIVLGRCKALYSYSPKLYDELELNPGDIIEVHAKQDDGWWLGALGNQVGIFPATYVEEYP